VREGWAPAFRSAERRSAAARRRPYRPYVTATGRPARARGLLLDIGGVVLESGPVMVDRLARDHPRLQRLLEPLGGISGPGDDLWARMLTREVSEREYWAVRSPQITGAAGTPGDTRALMDLLYTGPSDRWLRQVTLDLMAEVKAAGLRLGALTNDMADFHGREWVDAQGWVRTFDVVVDGSVTGVLKPDPRAYAAGVAAMGLPADEIVYLDDMPWNVEGGLAAGLRAVRMPHGDPTDAVAQVRDLLGLAPRAAA
jgi:putative hydrolase of the HAD superfamily